MLRRAPSRVPPASAPLRPAARWMTNAAEQRLAYPGEEEAEARGDSILNEEPLEFSETQFEKQEKVERKSFDADADFFKQQKQKLEAAHRIEKDLNESKISPEVVLQSLNF